jgi:replicative DNA helicase
MAIQKVPPHSDDAEKSVLGSILIDKDAIVQVSEFLQPEHFYQNKHADIFEAMIKLFESREPIDLVTLPQKLKSMKLLEAVGGVSYISSLVDGVPSSANIRHYGEIIQGYYTRRRLIADSSSMIEMSFDESSDISGILDSAEQKVFSLSQSSTKQGFIPIRSVLSESFDRLDELSKKSGTLRGVPSGFTDLDNCLAGMQDSNLLILAARPGMGKCVSGDTWMTDPDTGERMRMDEFVKIGKGRVLSIDKQWKLTASDPSIYLNDGIKPVWEVVTALGNKLKATAVHPLLTMDGWKRVEELKVHDRIAVPRTLPVFGKSKLEDYKIATLAYLLGDGGLTNSTPRFTNGNPRVREDFASWANQFEGVLVSNISSNGRTQSMSITKNSESRHKINSVTQWLQQLGLMGKGALEKYVPEEIFTLPREKIALFLNRLYACDGSIVIDRRQNVRLSYASSSYIMAEQVKHLLLRYGILASLREKSIKYKEGKRIAYKVEVFGAKEIVTFIKEIGIFGKETRLQEALKIVEAKNRVVNWTHDTLPMSIWKVIKDEMKDISWADLYKKMKKSPGYNIHVGKRQLRRDTVLEVAEAINSEYLRQLSQSDIFWDTIVSIESKGSEQVYDLTVDDLHNFVAGDIFVHNTAFSLNIAQYASVVAKVPVGYFSLEMSKEELVDRMLVSQADIDAWRLKTGKLTPQDFEKLSEAMGVLAEAPLYIDDTPGISVLEMRTKARRLKSEHNVGLIFVDYLQLVKGRNLENRVQEVAEISQGMKNLARELKIPVVAMSQLSRAIENRGAGSAPQLSDLRESGSIEQDADVVMFLYREDAEDLSTVKLNIAKHRNGALRTIDLRFKGDRVRFYGVDKAH